LLLAHSAQYPFESSSIISLLFSTSSEAKDWPLPF